MKRFKTAFALLSTLLLLSCAKEPQRVTILRVHGSNTIGAELMPKLVTEWLKSKNGENIRVITAEPEEQSVHATLKGKPVAVEIHSYGSSTGFADLSAGNCDIAMSSKPVPDKSVKSLTHIGDMRSPECEHVLALDGIAIIVNPSSPVKELPISKIAALFSGEIRDWSGIDSTLQGEVHIYRRDNNSGTHEVFKKLVTAQSRLHESATVALDNNELVQRVKEDPLAMGYSSVTFTGETKSIGIVDAGGTVSLPSTFAVQTEDYPLSRRLFLYRDDFPVNPYVKDLLEFALARSGQNIVGKSGFIPQTVKLVKPTPLPGAPTLYREETEHALRFSMNFRFIPGSSRLDNRSLRDISRLASFIESEQLGSCSLKLFGFSDNVGDPSSNRRLSYYRAKTVGSLLQEQTGVSVDVIRGFGEALPVADNGDSQGRKKNRRVEVWISCDS